MSKVNSHILECYPVMAICLPDNFSSENINESSHEHNSNCRITGAPLGIWCYNCNTTTSPEWRYCPRPCRIHNDKLYLCNQQYLCNACGLRYYKGQYCPLCYVVYYQKDTNNISWKNCIKCNNWTHRYCIKQSTASNYIKDDYICKKCVNCTIK